MLETGPVQQTLPNISLVEIKLLSIRSGVNVHAYVLPFGIGTIIINSLQIPVVRFKVKSSQVYFTICLKVHRQETTIRPCDHLGQLHP